MGLQGRRRNSWSNDSELVSRGQAASGLLELVCCLGVQLFGWWASWLRDVRSSEFLLGGWSMSKRACLLGSGAGGC